MIKTSNIEIEFNNKVSEHILYHQDDAKCLVVIFPGGGNSSDRPIIHYSSHFLLYNNKCDILYISYKNMIDKEDTYELIINSYVNAISKIFDKVEEKKSYKSKIFISFSMGNLVSNELKIRKSIISDKNIYISPTADAMKFFETYPGLIITASKDEYLPQEKLDELKEKYKDNILVFEDGTHALENNNVPNTLEFCRTAVTSILDYLDVKWILYTITELCLIENLKKADSLNLEFAF